MSEAMTALSPEKLAAVAEVYAEYDVFLDEYIQSARVSLNAGMARAEVAHWTRAGLVDAGCEERAANVIAVAVVRLAESGCCDEHR